MQTREGTTYSRRTALSGTRCRGLLHQGLPHLGQGSYTRMNHWYADHPMISLWQLVQCPKA